MRFHIPLITTLTAGLLLSACVGPVKGFKEIDALNQIQPSGSAFTAALTAEYRGLANTELHSYEDYPDALHFARKGLVAASGEIVLPEPLGDWNLNVAQIKELGTARGELINMLNLGAREVLPVNAAKAQAMFDCWIEQEEEHSQGAAFGNDMKGCKSSFQREMNTIRGQIGLPQAPAALPAPVKQQTLTGVAIDPSKPMAPENAMFLVFFDWDSHTLNATGRNVINAVKKEIVNNRLARIKIVGHADTSGPRKYNNILAAKRAETVRKALVSAGINSADISVSSRGEDELLVETSDNVREPANRRAQISFE